MNWFKISSDLFLIIGRYTGHTCIKWDELFEKWITGLLNTVISNGWMTIPVFKLWDGLRFF